MNSMILVTCGATAADIKSELGLSRNDVNKVLHGEGNYGDYILDVTDDAAIRMQKKYPKVVRII